MSDRKSKRKYQTFYNYDDDSSNGNGGAAEQPVEHRPSKMPRASAAASASASAAAGAVADDKDDDENNVAEEFLATADQLTFGREFFKTVAQSKPDWADFKDRLEVLRPLFTFYRVAKVSLPPSKMARLDNAIEACARSNGYYDEAEIANYLIFKSNIQNPKHLWQEPFHFIVVQSQLLPRARDSERLVAQFEDCIIRFLNSSVLSKDELQSIGTGIDHDLRQGNPLGSYLVT